MRSIQTDVTFPQQQSLKSDIERTTTARPQCEPAGCECALSCIGCSPHRAMLGVMWSRSNSGKPHRSYLSGRVPVKPSNRRSERDWPQVCSHRLPGSGGRPAHQLIAQCHHLQKGLICASDPSTRGQSAENVARRLLSGVLHEHERILPASSLHSAAAF